METLPTGNQHLVCLGQSIFGKNWKWPLSDRLNIDRRTVARWAKADIELSVDHPVFDDLTRIAAVEMYIAGKRAEEMFDALHNYELQKERLQ